MAAGQLDISEQYTSVLRTRSYQSILGDVQEQLRAVGRKAPEENDNSDNSLERREEPAGEEDPSGKGPERRRAILLNLAEDCLLPEFDGEDRQRGLLRDFLDRGLKASELCYQLLESIAGARAYNDAVRRIVDERGSAAHLWELARFASLDNPLSQPRLAHFLRHHGDRYAAMVPRLRSQKKTFPRFGRAALRRRSLDEAARGAYGVYREFGTVGRQLVRLNDEIEHERFLAKTLLRDGGGGFRSWKKEVVRELREGEDSLGDQLQELEERVHLCLLTIVRVWKLLTRGHLSPCTTIPPKTSLKPQIP